MYILHSQNGHKTDFSSKSARNLVGVFVYSKYTHTYIQIVHTNLMEYFSSLIFRKSNIFPPQKKPSTYECAFCRLFGILFDFFCELSDKRLRYANTYIWYISSQSE